MVSLAVFINAVISPQGGSLSSQEIQGSAVNIPYFIDEIRATKEVPKVIGLKPGKRTYVPDSSSHHWLPGESEKNSVSYHVEGFLDSDGSRGVARRPSRCAHIVSLEPAFLAFSW